MMRATFFFILDNVENTNFVQCERHQDFMRSSILANLKYFSKWTFLNPTYKDLSIDISDVKLRPLRVC